MACHDVLGEGAVWDLRRQQLWWVDVPMPGARIHSLDPATGAVTDHPMPQMVMSLRPKRDGAALIATTHSGICRFDIATGTLTHLLDPEPMKPYNRSNDGGTDARGRLWFGTMQNNMGPAGEPLDMAVHAGTLFRLDPDMTLTAHQADVGISNTVCWSPDSRTMYFGDTATETIFAYDFDLDDGVISNKRPFARFDRGYPDGSTIDADGCLWNARWDGNCVVRFTPRGEVDLVVEVPVAKVTSCAFGGPGLSDLYITTARYGMDEAAFTLAPESGNLFICRPGATGLPTPEFG